MQMNRSDDGESDLQSEINITPLVDVVLVLLIIFMVMVPILLKGYDVEIPRASSDTVPAEAQATQVILKLDSTACKIFEPPAGEGLPGDCHVSLDEHDIPAADLSARVAEMLAGRPAEQHVLFLAVDERLNYEAVLRIVDLAKSGVEDLRIEFVSAN